jgi:hypothetical protein
MQLKTILNRVQKHSSFVYGEMRLREGEVPELEVAVRVVTGDVGERSPPDRGRW